MAELIDKWEVVSKLITLQNNYNFFKNEWDAERLCREIAKLEIGIGKTSGVEVVRCKDCRYFYRDDEFNRAWCGYDKCVANEVAVNGYCYRGERKDNG